MAVKSIADTGAMLALLDADDKWHSQCSAAFEALHKPLGTTVAVLTELFHLARRSRTEAQTVWRLVRSDAVCVLPIVDEDLLALDTLMTKYADRPMDFADATLVHLAERESTNVIFTIDHNDFETYRVHGRPFEITPPRTP